MSNKLCIAVAALVLLLGAGARAQYVQVEVPLEQLPQEHEYQRTLRQFLSTLTAEDFEVEPQTIEVVELEDTDQLYRLWLLAQKNVNYLHAARMPAEMFTLKSIESQQGLLLPISPNMCQSLAWLASWDYPGNPYQGSRALKLRALTLAAVDTVMLDYLYEHDPRGADRSDYLGGNLIWISFTLGRAGDVLPPEVHAALVTGLMKHVRRLQEWGPTGQMTDMDLFAPVGLAYLAEVVDDPEFDRLAADYSRQLFTDERYYHPAGYFVDNGCFDTSYNGISLFFAAWAAAMTDWDFADRAVEQSHRLRAYLSFPDPDALDFGPGGGAEASRELRIHSGYTGPSHMSSRTSGDPPRDQWQFPPRLFGAPLLTDEAAWWVGFPDEARLRAAPAEVAAGLNSQLEKPAQPQPQTWKENHWGTVINFSELHYTPGYYQHRKELEARGAEILKPVFRRDDTFIEPFEKAFVIAKQNGYGTALHTGPVGRPAGHMGRMYGFGGGQLSVFWTPDTGVVIAGRRRGVQGAVWDDWSEWRLWPNHAVTGQTADGTLVTSSRVRQPEVEYQLSDDRGLVRVAAPLPRVEHQPTTLQPTGYRYERDFAVEPGHLKVATRVLTAETPEGGRTKLAELYETIPVFLRETSHQEPSVIRFRVAGQWVEPTTEAQAGVEAVRIERFEGAAEIVFAQPQSVKLAPEVWQDGYQTRAECRNLLIDLLAGSGEGETVASLEYTIQPAAK